MVLRPQATIWFEVLTPHDHLASALGALSRTDAVELQAHTSTTSRILSNDLQAGLAEYREAQRRYSSLWPPMPRSRTTAPRQPATMLSDALMSLRGWTESARSIIERIEQMTEHRAVLKMLLELLEQSSALLPSLQALGGAGPMLAARIFVMPAKQASRAIPEGVLTEFIATPSNNYLLAVGTATAIAEMERLWSGESARMIRPPSNLPVNNHEAAAAMQDALRANDAKLAELRAQLLAQADEWKLPAALADLAFLDWFSANVPALSATENFAWITGWSSDSECARLKRALDADNVPYLLHTPGCPQGLEAPVVLRNPKWARPFELFARLLGTPGTREADPSVLVAVLAPITFGFMFGDVGQGAVLLGLGLALRKRYPMLTLLIAGGIASMGFGLLFGSVFAREHIVEPLWLAPLDQPLTVLVASLALGAVVVLLGLVIDGMQFLWAGQGSRWLAANAGLIPLYIGVLATPFRRAALFLVLLGVLWFACGHAYLAATGARAAAVGRAIGELAETSLQLIVNTLSFLRVGAFALAHAGLSVAVVGLADATSSGIGALVVLVIGNVFVIALEALVVGIQTTRLVLFEFFVRFLQGVGRPFRPLPAAFVPAVNNKGDEQ